MEIDYSLVGFKNLELKQSQAVKLRGFFANLYEDNKLVHNHNGRNVIYQYPKVQYKVIDSIPTICGVEEGVNIIRTIGYEVDSIKIDNETLEVFQKRIEFSRELFGMAKDYVDYKFITPWMALNQKNAIKYEKFNDIEKGELLKQVLIGNILSLAKGLNYTVEEKIYVWIDLEEISVNFKNIKMKAFKGKFRTNFVIPNYLGIGKSVARGFGTVKGG